MRAFLYLITLILLAGCSAGDAGPTVEEVQNNLNVSIILPVKERDYSFHNNGVYGVYENPSVQKTFKAKIQLSADITVANTNLKVKWRSNIDGELLVGNPNADYESILTTSLSKGLHKVYIEVYLGNNPELIQKDSITISNVVKLEATPDKGRIMKLNWTKYEGNDFVSYLLYHDSNEPIIEISDINTLQYDYAETFPLADEHHYQVVVKTNSALVNETLGSNIVGKVTGDFISFPYYVRKMVKDPTRPKLYAIATPKDLDETADKYGVVIINTDTFIIEDHILTTTRFTDLSVSPDGQYLYLTQRHVDVITKVNLNTYNSSTIITHTSGYGFENIEAGNNNLVYAYVYNDASNMQMINTSTWNYSVAGNGFASGDMRYNSLNDNLYMGESNTSGGHIYKLNPTNFVTGNLYNLPQYPIYPYDIGYPYPLVTLSDDMSHIFWDEYEVDENLNLLRHLNTVIHACSPSNQYLSDLNKVYNYSTMNTVLSYPSFGNYEFYDSDIYFIDNNTIITSKTYDPNDGNPSYSYFFRIKIN